MSFEVSSETFDGEMGPLQLPTISHTLVNFTIPSMSANNWTSPNTTSYNHPGMDGLFSIANQTLNAIWPKYEQYLDYAENYNNYSDFSNVDVLKSLVWENKGPLTFVICMLLFGIILTLCGFGWCFAKCCCGDKGCCNNPKDADDVLSKKLVQKRDKCKRTFYGVIFAGLIILFMFGLVCCFVTNEKLKASVEQMPTDVDNALTDTQMYLDTTKSQIVSLFINNYDTLAIVLNDNLDRSGEMIKNGLSERTGLEALRNLTDLLETVEGVRTTLQSVETSSRNLKLQAKQLELGLTERKKKLLELLEQCDSPRCAELKGSRDIRTLRVENDFKNALGTYLPKLPNMTEILAELGTLLGTDVKYSIERGKQSFDELSFRIQHEVEPVIPQIRNKIKITGDELSKVARQLTTGLDKVPVSDTKKNLYEAQELVEKYEPQRYYAVLGVCILLSFIFSLLVFGIFIGFCGKQPGSEYSNECCSRKTGSGFINCGIFFIFLTVGALTAFSLILFLGAGALTQVACDAITSMDNRTETILQIPKIHIENSKHYQVPPYSTIIAACKRGASAYDAFGLKDIYDIRSVRALSDRFTEEVNKLAGQVHLPPGSTQDITFLTPEAKRSLDRFANSRITRMNFESIIDELTASVITSVDLNEVIKRINDTLDDAENILMDNDVRLQLMNEAMHLDTLNVRVLLPMLDSVKQSAENLKSLAREQKDLAGRIQAVANAAQKAQDSFRSPEAARQIEAIAFQFADEFVTHINHYANFTYDQIDQVVGSCLPLYTSFSASVSTFCVKIGAPFAGFWFALTCILILFVPLIIFGSTLARLYRKYKTGVYETETYYSTAHGDGDTIPLSLSANQGRRPKRGRQTQQAAGDSRNHGRFEDTSHNWEGLLSQTEHEILFDPEQSNGSEQAWGSQMAFNNHHTPPASGEYERPPPYYYPGVAPSAR